jgi:hypothetical protein
MSKHLHILKWLLSLLAATFLLAGCGGGSSGGSSSTAISGTVATGAAVTGTIDLVDAAGVTKQATIGTNGAFTIDTTGLSAPFILRATGNGAYAGTVLFSMADGVTGVFNITPLTTLALELVRQGWSGTPPADLTGLFSNWNADIDPADLAAMQAAILEAQAVINANLASQFQANGLTAATYDFLRTAFTPNSTGIDALLDAIELAISGSGITMNVGGNPLQFNFSIDISGFNIGGSGGGGSLTCSGGTAMTYAGNAGIYTNGQEVCFTGSATSLAFSGKTLTGPTQNNAVSAPFSAYTFADTTTGYNYEVVFNSGALYEINVLNGATFLGQFAPSGNSGGAGGNGGTNNLVLSVTISGVAAANISIDGVPKPASQNEFCSDMTSNSTTSLSNALGAAGTFTINSCTFNGTVGNVSATLSITNPVVMTVPYTVVYTYN